MDGFEPVTGQEYARLMTLLEGNAETPFVQRILNPKDYPTLDLGDGNHATHRMAWGQVGNQFIAFPTVLMTEGGLKDFGDSAFDEVLRSGDYIKFDNPQDAEWFTKRYKGAWGGAMNRPPQY